MVCVASSSSALMHQSVYRCWIHAGLLLSLLCASVCLQLCVLSLCVHQSVYRCCASCPCVCRKSTAASGRKSATGAADVEASRQVCAPDVVATNSTISSAEA
jgi:hypothetical protein